MIETIPLYPLAAVLFLAAGLLFLLQMARHLRVFADARPARLVDSPEARVHSLVRHTFLQVRMFHDPLAGGVHALIFWGFIVLTIGTIDRIFFGVVEAVSGSLLEGWPWRLLLVAQNAFMVAVLVAVGVAIGRRLLTRPRRLTLSRDGLVILLLIGGVVLTELLAEAFRLAAQEDPDAGFAFAANTLAAPLAALPAELAQGPLEAGYALAFWANVGLISFFLAYLPRSKHLHIVTAAFNTAFARLTPRGRLPDMDLEAETARFGVKSIEDLDWKDLLDGFTCTECGRCQEACPAWATGKPLDPKTLIMGLREMSVEAERGLPLVPWIRPGEAAAAAAGAVPEPIVGTAIPYDAVWDCVTCGACVESCPVLIEHVDKIVGLRRNLVLEESRFPTELTAAFTAMERHGNPWGQPARARLDWTRGLPFPVPAAAEVAARGPGAIDELECLYWVGCAAAFDDRNRRVAQAVVTCLEAAGVRYAVLGQEESCTGDPARRMGNEYVFQLLAAGNVATLDGYGAKTIVTACPHCFNTLANEYPSFGGHYEVVHHSQYLARLAADGRLRLAEDATGRSVTLHDPCYLARYNGVIEAPREVLRVIPGAQVLEMEKHGRETFCCGAGGGRMWMEEVRGTRMNAERTRQALETGAQEVATACPFCLVMLRDGLADAHAGGGEARVEARDIAEIMAARLATADTLEA